MSVSRGPLPLSPFAPVPHTSIICHTTVSLRFFPGVDETKLFPIDVMHAEGDGMLSEEAYQCFHVLCKVREYFTLQRLNFILRNAPDEMWPDGVAVRPIHSSVMDGLRVKRGMRMRWTAAETHKFARASVKLFDHLVPEDEIVWRCWKLHVSYLEIMLQPTLTTQDVALMDKLIFDHQTLYRQVCVLFVYTSVMHTHT